jgi:hypothetical protein
MRPLASTCATGMGLGVTVSVDLRHRSGLEYLSHGFQTQGTIAARVGLKVRPESTCVPGPWISDPRYGCRQSGLEGATGVDLCAGPWISDPSTVATVVDLKVRPESTCVPGPWISDPRYEAQVLRVLGPIVQSVKTTCS